jgi:hypothetical protein
MNMQFTGIEPNFNNLTMANFAWISQKHSINAQVQGFMDKTGVILTPIEPPLIPPTEQLKEKEKEKEKEEVKEKNKTCFSFDDFWEMYGKKVSRKDAEKKYNKLSESVRSKIKETLPTYLSTIKDKQFQKDPTTYMNKECWNDEIVTKTTPDIPNTMDLDWRQQNIINKKR